MKFIKSSWVFFLCFFFSQISVAQSKHAYEIKHDLLVDGILTGTALTATLLSESLLKSPLAAEECRWCKPPSFDIAVRDTLKWEHTRTPLALSDYLVATQALSQMSLLWLASSSTDHPEFVYQDILLMSEAVLLGAMFTNSIKWIVGRQRPHVRFGHEGLSKRESNLSFFSGHSAFTSSIAAASATLAFLRGYDEAPWILGLGTTLALTTSYMRVAGDVHYFSDVTTGLLVGTAFGIGIPLLFHARKSNQASSNTSLSMGLSTASIAFRF